MLDRHEISDALAELKSTLTEFGSLLKAGIGDGLQFTGEVARASYQLCGQHTLPGGDAIYSEAEVNEKISLSDLNIPGVIALSIPIVLPITLSTLTWLPIFGNSIPSFVSAYVDATNLALFDSPDIMIGHTTIFGVDTSNRNKSALRHTYGLPGYLLGAVTGAVSALTVLAVRGIWNFFYHSARSLGKTFAHIVNLASAEDYAIHLSKDKRHPFKKYAISIVGIALGAILGSATALVVLAARGIWNFIYHSTHSLARTFAHIVNLASANDYAIHLDEDKRHPFKKYAISIIGIAFGAVLGSTAALIVLAARGIWNFIYHSTLSLARTCAHIINLASGNDYAIPLEEDKRHPFKKYIISIVGIALGAVLGGFSALIILATRGAMRIILHSLYSTPYAFLQIVNFALEKEDEIAINEYDKRHWFKKYVLGFSGYCLGAVLGMASALIILAARGIWNILLNSTRSFPLTFVTIVNLALAKESEMELGEDKRHWVKIYGLGLIGYALGAVLGSATALIVLAARGLWKFTYHSTVAIARTFVPIVRLALPGHYDKESLGPDNRAWYKKYIFGLTGYPIGFVLGSISALVILAVRGIWNVAYHSPQSFSPVFWNILNLVVSNDWKQRLFKDKRHWFKRFGFGLIGCALGIAIASVPAILILAARGIWNVTYHSARSFSQVFWSITNLVVAKKHEQTLESDQRHWLKRFGFGLAGYILGIPIAIAASISILAARGIYNFALHNLFSFEQICTRMLNLSFSRRNEIEIEDDDRHWIKRFGVGLVGHILGSVLGFYSALVTLAARGIWNFAYHSTRSFSQLFWTITNLAVAEGYEISSPIDDRHGFKKFGLGLVGAAVGIALGAASASVILMTRFIWSFLKNTTQSWSALSGSLLNGAANRFWFEGLGGDDRSDLKKFIGGLGYIAALASTAPIATVMFTLRVAPLVSGFLAMMAISPLVLLLKLFAKLLENVFDIGSRFKESEKNAIIITKFKNLYSSLSGNGKLVAGNRIIANGSGKDRPTLFFYKSATLNIKALQEKLLDILLAAYRNDNNFFNTDNYIPVIEKFNERFVEGFLYSAKAVEQKKQLSMKFAEFVKSYMTKPEVSQTIPKDLNTTSVQESSWSARFWGGKKPQRQPGMSYTAQSAMSPV